MSRLITVSMALALLSSSAIAHDVEIGAGVLCDRADQAERFASLDANPAAVSTINANAPHACEFETVAYIKGASGKEVQANGHAVRITEILVVAFKVGKDWQKLATPSVQFTLFPVADSGA